MAIQVQGNSGNIAEVIDTSIRALNVTIKPLGYAALGHYRTSLRIQSTAAQAANSRILEIRNSHPTNLIVPTRLILRAFQTAAGTAQENSLDVFKVTGFTAVDTVNTVTPTSSVKRTTGMVAYPGTSAVIRHLTFAGAAAGMTGGTLVKDANVAASLPYIVNAAAASTNAGFWGPYECFDGLNGTHPFVLVQNEGLIVENRVLNVTSFGITWYIDIAWADVVAF